MSANASRERVSAPCVVEPFPEWGANLTRTIVNITRQRDETREAFHLAVAALHEQRVEHARLKAMYDRLIVEFREYREQHAPQVRRGAA